MRTVAWFAFSLLLAGCAVFKNAGSDLGAGLSDGVKSNADTIGTKLGSGVVQGARDTLTSEETRKRLTALVDQVGATLARQAAASRDTLLGEYTRAWIDNLKQSLLGAQTKEQLGAIRDELLGPKTTAFLGDSLRIAVAGLRNELLGATTQSALDSIISRSLTTLSQTYRDKMQPLVRGEESFVQRNITAILWTAGGLVAGILVLGAWVQAKRRKERGILDLLTYQIHEIPEQKAYDELVTRIRRKAQELGLEPRLQELLRERGILGKEAWVTPGSPGQP
ncbi:MAG: hypothetical protein WB699_17075 [Bacteroidota bacterium]